MTFRGCKSTAQYVAPLLRTVFNNECQSERIRTQALIDLIDSVVAVVGGGVVVGVVAGGVVDDGGMVSISRYHVIRTQEFMKLYVIFNMLDIFDRLVTVFGQESFERLYRTICYYDNKKTPVLAWTLFTAGSAAMVYEPHPLDVEFGLFWNRPWGQPTPRAPYQFHRFDVCVVVWCFYWL